MDNGSIENIYQQRKLIEICSKIKSTLKKNKIKLIFESDFGPIRLQNFIKKFDKKKSDRKLEFIFHWSKDFSATAPQQVIVLYL